MIKKYNFRDHPQELKKKVSLFNHFKGYLQTDNENKVLSKATDIDVKKLLYVRRWFRSKHAVIFRLNNKSVQVIFIDQSELLINSLSKQVIYTNKYKEKS
jgi:polo-like kinase 1